MSNTLAKHVTVVPTKTNRERVSANLVSVVPTALLVRQVAHSMPSVARLEPMPVVQHPALDALLRVALASQKRLRALRHRIVFALKTFVLVTMALQRRAQIVPPMVIIFVPVSYTHLTLPTTPYV